MPGSKGLKAEWFAETRRIHNADDARLTPAERLGAADELFALALEARRLRGGVEADGSDEPPELWLRLRARFRGDP
jgi:hypothetical protein